VRIVVAGGHGRVARRLGRLLTARGDSVIGIVRSTQHEIDLTADGMDTVVMDLERASLDDLASVVVVADAVVFAAGAPPGSGGPHKDAVDRAGALRLADAADAAAVRPFLLMSSMGVEAIADGRVPESADETWVEYLRAKWAAEEGVRARPAVDMTVVRPARLTDDPGTGRVTLGRNLPDGGTVPRDDVAAVLMALLDSPRPGSVVEVISGATPIDQAVAALG
jgi:nucleoside-diphosphate-sugar epimerase